MNALFFFYGCGLTFVATLAPELFLPIMFVGTVIACLVDCILGLLKKP